MCVGNTNDLLAVTDKNSSSFLTGFNDAMLICIDFTDCLG